MSTKRELKELARALVEIARIEGVLADIIQQLRDVNFAFRGEPGLLADLHEPVTAREKRQVALRKGLQHECHQLLVNALLVLQDLHLLDEISLFSQSVEHTAHEIAEYMNLQITSAIPLTKQEKSSIEHVFTKKKRILHIEQIIDPTLIGGFILDYHGNRVDASILGMSKRLKHVLHGV